MLPPWSAESGHERGCGGCRAFAADVVAWGRHVSCAGVLLPVPCGMFRACVHRTRLILLRCLRAWRLGLSFLEIGVTCRSLDWCRHLHSLDSQAVALLADLPLKIRGVVAPVATLTQKKWQSADVRFDYPASASVGLHWNTCWCRAALA